MRSDVALPPLNMFCAVPDWKAQPFFMFWKYFVNPSAYISPFCYNNNCMGFSMLIRLVQFLSYDPGSTSSREARSPQPSSYARHQCQVSTVAPMTSSKNAFDEMMQTFSRSSASRAMFLAVSTPNKDRTKQVVVNGWSNSDNWKIHFDNSYDPVWDPLPPITIRTSMPTCRKLQSPSTDLQLCETHHTLHFLKWSPHSLKNHPHHVCPSGICFRY